MSDSTRYASKLKGQKVLVIGGSSGIGYAVAEASIEHGATVIISSSSQQKIDKAVERITAAYPSAKDRVSGIPCDLGNASTLEQNVVDLLKKVGKLDHIVHTAGEPLKLVPLSEITPELAFKSSLVRFHAPLMIGKHARDYLNPGPRSSITISTGGIIDKPMADWVLPKTTMHAVAGLVPQLALELAPIRVNNVCPGAVETELWNGMSKEQFEGFKKHTEDTAPTGRLAQPDDLAEAYIYLMKDINATGSIVRSNSGAILTG